MSSAHDAEIQYRRAFEDFSDRVRRVQRLAAQTKPDQRAMESALVELEKARVVYDTSRDAWVQYLLPKVAGNVVAIRTQNSPEQRDEHVRAIAELLWESAGRPEGTAEEDWRRAEQIVQKAVTAA